MPMSVVDSGSASVGLGLIVPVAATRASAGASLAEVVGAAEHASRRCQVYAALDTAEYLEKGGRAGATQQSPPRAGLSIKPTVEIRDGVVQPGPKQRTRGKALQFLADRVVSQPVDRLGVAHAEAPDLPRFLDLVADHVPREQIVIADLGPVIGAHLGPRALSVAFLDP